MHPPSDTAPGVPPSRAGQVINGRGRAAGSRSVGNGPDWPWTHYAPGGISEPRSGARPFRSWRHCGRPGHSAGARERARAPNRRRHRGAADQPAPRRGLVRPGHDPRLRGRPPQHGGLGAERGRYPTLPGRYQRRMAPVRFCHGWTGQSRGGGRARATVRQRRVPGCLANLLVPRRPSQAHRVRLQPGPAGRPQLHDGGRQPGRLRRWRGPLSR